MAAPLSPVERDALLTAFAAPEHTLRRTRDGFVSPTAPTRRFTRRCINWLDNRALVTFDDPQLPRLVRLNDAGVRQAQTLIDQARADHGAVAGFA